MRFPRGQILPAVLIVAVLAAMAALLALWWLGRSFHNRTAVQTAAVRATPPAGALRTDPPFLVREYLARSGVPDPARMRWVRIEQRGEMRLSPGGPWLPFTAVQHMAVAQPAFVWQAEMRMAGGFWTSVVDRFVENRGSLEARLLGAIPVAHAAGPDVDRGEVQRYLAELPWNPAAMAANPALSLRPADARRVDVTAPVNGGIASVTLRFDDAGDIMEASASARPRLVAGRAVPTPWAGAFGEYRVLNGLRLPTRAAVWWDLPEGRFEYWRAEVTGVAWE